MSDVKKLYNALLSHGYTADDLGDENTFTSAMADADNRKELYFGVRADGFDLGNYDDFEKRLTSDTTVDTSPSASTNPIVGHSVAPDVSTMPKEDASIGKANIPSAPKTSFGVNANIPSIADMTKAKIEGRNVIPAFSMENRPQVLKGFGEGVKQGTEQLGAGLEYAVGEAIAPVVGTSYDDKAALEEIERLQAEGKDVLEETKNTTSLSSVAPATARALEFLGAKQGIKAAEKKAEVNQTIQQAIKDAGGDIDAAKSLLAERAGKVTNADTIRQHAEATMAKAKPTKGWAWVGSMVPQMAAPVIGMGLTAVTKMPIFAQTLGRLNMGALTASTAGQAMAEARQAGATNADVWSAGIINGAIEYITEEIPFNHYTQRLANAAKNSASSAIKKMASDVGSPANKELQDLLAKANKQLDGKLLSGKNVSDYLADITAESISEGAAEGLQTISSIIYENPEDYPTLTEIINNSIEGLKGGLFMGSILGGASKTAEHRMNRNRRKQQGFVDVAEITLPNNQSAIIEIVMDENGNEVGYVDDVKIPITDNNVIRREQFSFDDFERGQFQLEQDEAYENGRTLEAAEEMNDANNMLDITANEVRRVFGTSEDSDVDAMLGDNPLQYALSEYNKDPEIGQTIIDYLNAKATVDGVIGAAQDRIELEARKAGALIDSRKSESDGMVHPAKMKLDDRGVYIISGNVKLLDDGSVDTNNSDESIIIMDAATGEKSFATAKDLLSLDDAIDPEAEKVIVRENIAETIATEVENKMLGVLPMNVGDTFPVLADDGSQHTVQIASNDGSGIVEVIMDNEAQTTSANKEIIQQMANAYNRNRAEQFAQGHKEQIQSENISQAPDTKVEESSNAIPLDKQGRPDFNAMEPDMFINEYVSRYGEDNAIKIARKNIEAARANIKKIDKKIDDVLDPNQMQSLFEQKSVAEAQLNRYNDILGRMGASEDANETEDEQRSRLKKESGNRIYNLFPDGFPNVESVILADIATGNRIRWSDKTTNGAVTSRGLAAELGLSDSNAERTRRLALISNSAPTPEEYAESLQERLNEIGVRYDESSLRDVVLDVYSSVDTRSGAWEALEEIAAGSQQEDIDTDWEDMQKLVAYEKAQKQEEREQELPDIAMTEDATPITEGEYAELEAQAQPEEQADYDAMMEENTPIEEVQPTTSIVALSEEKIELQNKIQEWLSPENISWAEGKELYESIEKFGNEVEPIAVLPEIIKEYFPEISSLYLYSGKGYLIDHAANHHPELAADEYNKIQEVVDSYDDIKDLSTPKTKKIAFVKMLDKGFAVVTELSEKDGKIMLHKTFFYKDGQGKRVPYKNKPSLLKKSSVGGSTTISPTETAAGRHRNISALDASESKDTTSEPQMQEVEEEILQENVEEEVDTDTASLAETTPFTVLSEDEYVEIGLAKVKPKEMSQEDWEYSDEYKDAYNEAADSYPDYIKALAESGELQKLFDNGNLGEQIAIRKNIQTAGFEVADLISTGRGKKAKVKKSRGQELMESLGLDTKEEARRKPLRERAKMWEEKVGVKVNLIESEADIPTEAAKRAVAEGQRVTGWVVNGEVFLYMPYIANRTEIDKTYLHEVVAHVGMKNLLGTEGYKAFCERVFNEVMTKAQQDYYRSYPNVKNDAMAADEFIAHLSEDTDMNASVWQKIVRIFRDALRKMGVDVRLTNADIEAMLRDSYKKLTEENGMADINEKDGQAMFSIRTYREGGKLQLDQFLNGQVKKKRITKEEAKEIADTLDEMYKTAVKYKNKYAPFGAWSEAKVVENKDGMPAFSVIKKNGDYSMNLDFSTVCKKRRTLDAVFSEMIQRGLISNLDLDGEQIAEINNIIRRYGFETACALCFVDAKRFRVAQVADKFCEMWNPMAVMTNRQLRAIIKAEGDTVRSKVAKYLLDNPDNRIQLKRENFIDSHGFEEMEINNPEILSLYKQAQGTSLAKIPFGDVQYLNDLEKRHQWIPDKAYAVGGVRLQPFSDYVPRMFFDYMQLTADLAAKNLPVHAYTKEPIFAKQFGLTGMKINLSLVPKVVDGGVAAGLDADGNYAWMDGETFPYEEAMALQNAEGYRENCGTIAVGVSDAHIEKLLGDPNIRMVIPYHKSGLNPLVAKKNRINEFVDYTNVQNTRSAEGTKLESEDLAEMPNFNALMHYEGMDARQAAQAYLDWCDSKGYLPKFDKWRNHPNYYKLLEDFTTIVPDANGVETTYPQTAVSMTFPTKESAFGSIESLIREGLEEDAVLEGRRDANVGKIVDTIEEELIQFRFIGEKGAANIDKAEEATIRLDNLAIARLMEFEGNTDKSIKMATGWERGADGKWRYEVNDDITAKHIRSMKGAGAKKILEARSKRMSDLDKFMYIVRIVGVDRLYDDKKILATSWPDAQKQNWLKAYEMYKDDSEGAIEDIRKASVEYNKLRNLGKGEFILYEVLGNDHSLFKEYPQLRNVNVILKPYKVGGDRGNYNRLTNTITIIDFRGIMEDDKGEGSANTLVHEIQHIIQSIEGFARGGNTIMDDPRKMKAKEAEVAYQNEMFEDAVKERNTLSGQMRLLNQAMMSWWDNNPDATWEDALADEKMSNLNKQYSDIEKQMEDVRKRVELHESALESAEGIDTSLGLEGYKRLAGEVEARNVERRRNMSLGERRNSPAWETEDVSRKDQIFIEDALGENSVQFRLSSSNKAIERYDNENGTDVKGFFDFLRGGKVFKQGKPKVFHIANAGDLLEAYGIKGKFMVGQFTFSRTHTSNDDHDLGVKEWVDVINNLNEPLAIVSYKGSPNQYRIYTYATINGKNICVGVNVSLKNGEIALSNIISAYGRDISNLLGREGVNLLYPEIEQLKRRISQVSTAHNSLLNATSSASKDKDNEKNADIQEESKKSSDTRFRVTPQEDALGEANTQFRILDTSKAELKGKPIKLNSMYRFYLKSAFKGVKGAEGAYPYLKVQLAEMPDSYDGEKVKFNNVLEGFGEIYIPKGLITKGDKDNEFFIDPKLIENELWEVLNRAENYYEWRYGDMTRFRISDYDRQFAYLQSEYDALDKNDATALNEWREKKTSVVRDYLTHIKDRFGMRSELIVFNGADEEQIREAYNKIVASYEANGNANPPTYEGFKKKSLRKDVVAMYRKNVDTITFNATADDLNDKMQFAETMFHEDAHRVSYGLYTSDEFETIWKDTKKSKDRIAKVVDRLYGGENDVTKGKEYIAKAVGYLANKQKNSFMQFLKGEMPVEELLKKLRSNSKIANLAVEETLNVIKDEYRVQVSRRGDTRRMGGVGHGSGLQDTGVVLQGNGGTEQGRSADRDSRYRVRVLGSTLADMVGEESYNKFLDGVFRDADDSIRREMVNRAMQNGLDFRTATQEYLANLVNENADSIFLSEVKDLYVSTLEDAGIDMGGISDNELRYVLWKNNQKDNGVFSLAEDVVMQQKMGVGNFRTRQMTEEEQIIADAKADGTYLKAPNGKDTNLTPKQWVAVRTNAFKKWFGDWEKAARIEKLRTSKDATITGDEIEVSDDLKQYKKNAQLYGRTLQGEYTNADTGAVISLQRGRHNGGINEVLHHNYKDIAHLQSVAAIPQIIENGIYIESQPNKDVDTNPNVAEYQMFVCGLNIGGEDYTVLAKVAVDNNGNRYYDHNLVSVEKGKLIDIANNEQSAISSGFGTTPDTKSTTNSQRKYKELISLLQTNSSKIVDANGEPKVVWHGGDFAIDDFTPKGDMHFGTFIAAVDRLNDKLVGSEGIVITENANGEFEWRFEDDYDDEYNQQGDKPFATKKEAYRDAFEKIGYTLKPYFLNMRNIERVEDANTDWGDVVEASKEDGYDGIVYMNRHEDYGSDSYIAFSPNQIKSAEGNTTFDANNDDIRFRSDKAKPATQDTARAQYDYAVRKHIKDRNNVGRVENLWHHFMEHYQDSMRSVKYLYKAILDETGNKLHDYEDVYKAENHLSSKNKAQIEAWERDYMKPLQKEILSLIEDGADYNMIQDYLLAKHGIERNRVLAQRDAEQIADSWEQKRLAGAQRAFRYEEKRINGSYGGNMAALKKALDTGAISQEHYNTQAEKLEKQRNKDLAKIERKYNRLVEKIKQDKPDMYDRAWDKLRDKDYSGLTELTGDKTTFNQSAQDMVDAFEAAYGTKKLWEVINAATKATLRKSYDSGMMNKETYEKTANMFKYYIPLRGWENNAAADYYEYLSSPNMKILPALKTAKGRTSRADDPIATIGSMGESSIIQGNRNLMKQKLLNFAQNNPTSLLTVSEQWYVRQPDGTWMEHNPIIPENATGDEVDAIVKKHEADMIALGENATKGRSKLNLGLHATTWEGQEHVVRVKRNGKEYQIFVNGNPIAAQAINGFTNPNTIEGWIKRVGQAIKNFMARAFTSQNPAFIGANLSRDVVWAGTAVAIKEDAAYAAQYTKNIAEAFGKAQLPRLISKWQKGTLDINIPIERYFKEFIENGGETGFTQLNTVDDYKRNMERFIKEAQSGPANYAKKSWRWVWDGIEFLNRSAEDTTRFMVYLTSRQMGRSITDSVSNAKDITVNFNKKGRGGYGATFMNFAYIFFNATIQSLANFGSLLKNHPKKTVTALTTFASVGLIAPMLSLAIQSMLSDDDEEPTYWDLPEWVRRNNIVIYMPFIEGGHLTIPLPHELRPFYGMGELAFSVLMGKESVEDALKKSIEGFASLLPFDYTGNGGNVVVNFTPTIAQPFAQLIVNKDYFGTPIYRKTAFNEKDPEWTKAYKSTNRTLVDATELVNKLTGGNAVKSGMIDINPAIVEHLFESYLGGMGKTINRTAKTLSMLWDEDAREWRNVPVLSSFYTISDERTSGSQLNREYFDAVSEAEDVEHLLSGYKKQAKLGAVEYAELLKDLMESDIYKRYEKVKGYKDAISELNTALKEIDDPLMNDSLETQIMNLKVDMLEELNSLENK